MTNVLICDDHKDDLKEISSIIKSYYDGNSCHISSFDKPAEALKFMENGNLIDIAILDILMPGMTGIELAAAMRSMNFSGHLAFLTSANDFAAESYGVKAFSYILKPVKRNLLTDLLDNIEKKRRESDIAGFKLTQRGSARLILFSELIYVEVISHNLNFHLETGEVITIYGSMKEYADILLNDPRMAQCHRSFILNMDYISYFENWSVVMRNGINISITRNYKDFKSSCYRYMFGKSSTYSNQYSRSGSK